MSKKLVDAMVHMNASLLGICPQRARTPHPSGGSPVSDALHLGVFDQPARQVFFSNLLESKMICELSRKSRE